MNVFNSVKTDVFSYHRTLHYFLKLPVGNGIKIATVYRRSIFQVEWLIATLIVLRVVIIN